MHGFKAVLSWLTVKVQRAQTFQVRKRHGSNQVDCVSGQSQINQACHVGKVNPAHFCDEVVSQPQLHGASVNVWGDKQEALVGTEGAKWLWKVATDAVEGTGRDHAPSLPCSNQRRQEAACDQS